jgi:hypothetical protein
MIFIHEYKGFGNCESKCMIYITFINGIHQICFEDMSIGTSVTNFSEHLATQMVKRFELVPKICRFFETYPDNIRNNQREVDEITYDWENNVATNPKWKPSNENIFSF